MIFNWEAVLSTVCYSAKWLGNHYDCCWWKALLLYSFHCLGLCQCTFHLNRLCLILTVCVGQGRKVIVWLMAQSVLYQMVNDALFLSWAPLSWPPLAQANWTRTFQWPPQPHFVCLFDALLKVCLSGWRMLLLRPKKWAAGHSVSLHYLFAQAHSVITHMLLLTVMAQIDFEGSLLPNSIKAAFLSSKSLPLASWLLLRFRSCRIAALLPWKQWCACSLCWLMGNDQSLWSRVVKCLYHAFHKYPWICSNYHHHYCFLSWMCISNLLVLFTIIYSFALRCTFTRNCINGEARNLPWALYTDCEEVST